MIITSRQRDPNGSVDAQLPVDTDRLAFGHTAKQETRILLLATARQMFSELGYAHTSMDDLTARAGLTRGALYHHFGDKKGLRVA